MDEKTKDLGDIEIYEIGYHILPTVAESEVESHVSKIHSFVSDKAGVVIAEEFPQMRSLAYDITKKIDTKNLNFNKAFFGWVKFELDRSLINEVKAQLDTMQTLLRFIIVKTVRENTIHTPKAPVVKKDEDNSEVVEDVVLESKPEVSEEEMDKSIDDLVVGETL